MDFYRKYSVRKVPLLSLFILALCGGILLIWHSVKTDAQSTNAPTAMEVLADKMHKGISRSLLDMHDTVTQRNITNLSSYASRDKKVPRTGLKSIPTDQVVIPSGVASKYSKILQKSKDGSGITLLEYTPIEIYPHMHLVQTQDILVMSTLQTQVVCDDWEMYGADIDGGWPVCRSPNLTPKAPCVVYSFGINYDWSFDEAYHKKHGCTIRTFDPSMGATKEHMHSPGVPFYPWGLSYVNYMSPQGWPLFTLKHLLRHFHETNITIPYLKFDVEGYEWIVLHNMIKDGVLNNVQQLALEVHIVPPLTQENLQYQFTALKALETIGFRRWYYHHRLNGFPYQCDQTFINIKYL